MVLNTILEVPLLYVQDVSSFSYCVNGKLTEYILVLQS